MRVLLILTALAFVILTVFDGQKLSYYLIYTVPLFTLIVALWLNRCWTTLGFENRGWRIFAAGVFCSMIALQIGGMIYRVKLNPYGKGYLPAMEVLNRVASDDKIVMGSARLGFGYGFRDNLIDDGRLGLYSGKRADVIVVEEIYQDSYNDWKTQRPEIYQYVNNNLTQDYQMIYDQAGYKIYVRR